MTFCAATFGEEPELESTVGPEDIHVCTDQATEDETMDTQCSSEGEAEKGNEADEKCSEIGLEKLNVIVIG